LVELLVVLALVAVLATLGVFAMPSWLERAARVDALAKTRAMGRAVLHYVPDHGGLLPPLFPGQVLEYEPGRGGRIVTECAAYLGIDPDRGPHLVDSLQPRAYARLKVPADPAQRRVWVVNNTVDTGSAVTHPFGTVTTPGEPPTGRATLAALAGAGAAWMLSTADRQHPNVASAPWRANTPAEPPLGDARAVFRFDGSAGLVNIGAP
jgi:hypothetical protein